MASLRRVRVEECQMLIPYWMLAIAITILIATPVCRGGTCTGFVAWIHWSIHRLVAMQHIPVCIEILLELVKAEYALMAICAAYRYINL